MRAARAAAGTGLTLLWPEVLAPQIRVAAAVVAAMPHRILMDTLVALA